MNFKRFIFEIKNQIDKKVTLNFERINFLLYLWRRLKIISFRSVISLGAEKSSLVWPALRFLIKLLNSASGV